jgi:hypothetical protein
MAAFLAFLPILAASQPDLAVNPEAVLTTEGTSDGWLARCYKYRRT